MGSFSNSFKRFFFPQTIRFNLWALGQICIYKFWLPKIIFPAQWVWFLEDLCVKTQTFKYKWITIMTRQIGKIRYFFLFEAVLCFSFFTGWVPASSFNAQLMANDRCIKWSWDFNGHLSLAVKGRLQKSCWELLQQPSVCQMDSFVPSAAHFLPSFSLTPFVFFQLNYILI